MARARLVTVSPIRRLVVAIVLAVGLVTIGSAYPAAAQPSIPELEAQITQEWNQLEPLIEQYNQLHTQLTANQAKSLQLQHQMQPLQLKVDLMQARVGVISAALYKQGPAAKLSAILSSGSPANLADELSMLDAIAHDQAQTVQSAATLVDQYRAQKQPLDRLIAVEAQQDADLAAKKNVIQSQMTNLQRLRQQAYGNSGMAGGAIKPVACPFEFTTGPGGVAARAACKQIGKPYVWATAGPKTFDCSGLTLYAWAQAGVTLGHFTGDQWTEARSITRAQLQPGDLVFFFPPTEHHVGLYVGGGWMVHAPTQGDVVRMARIDSPFLPIAGYRRPG